MSDLVYLPGTEHGIYTVVERLGARDEFGRLPIRARCRACGVVSAVTSQTLCEARRNKSTHCQHCSKLNPHRGEPKSKRCRKCEGLPWRRPVTGLCRCGKRYEAERFEMQL